ncbi:unnamed protein product, partial [Vitis vinifera]
MHIGVVGLGGLGHVAVKFAKAFGVKVTVISTSPGKKEEALERLGADSFVVSRDPDQMRAAMGTMDGIIDTVFAAHPLLPLIGLLKSHGKLILVAAPIDRPIELPVYALMSGRKLVASSLSGGLKETQEMIDFAGKHNVTADVEVVPIDYVNTAMERLEKADVRYRFVIDIGNTHSLELNSLCVLATSPEDEHPVKAFGWAARDYSGHLSPFNFSRRSTGEEDVRFKCCTVVYVTLIFTKSRTNGASPLTLLRPARDCRSCDRSRKQGEQLQSWR